MKIIIEFWLLCEDGRTMFPGMKEDLMRQLDSIGQKPIIFGPPKAPSDLMAIISYLVEVPELDDEKSQAKKAAEKIEDKIISVLHAENVIVYDVKYITNPDSPVM